MFDAEKVPQQVAGSDAVPVDNLGEAVAHVRRLLASLGLEALASCRFITNSALRTSVGTYDQSTDKVAISARACDFGLDDLARVLAHELGHRITRKLAPDLMAAITKQFKATQRLARKESPHPSAVLLKHLVDTRGIVRVLNATGLPEALKEVCLFRLEKVYSPHPATIGGVKFETIVATECDEFGQCYRRNASVGANAFFFLTGDFAEAATGSVLSSVASPWFPTAYSWSNADEWFCEAFATIVTRGTQAPEAQRWAIERLPQVQAALARNCAVNNA